MRAEGGGEGRRGLKKLAGVKRRVYVGRMAGEGRRGDQKRDEMRVGSKGE